MKKVLLTSLLILTAHQALAADQTTTEETNAPHGLYIGGGISYNDLDLGSIVKGADNETAMGLQVFAGVPIANAIKQKVVGVSGAVVLQRNLNEIDPNLYGLARIGYELGDDDGVFMGIGAGYRITPKVEVRAEFVNKDLVSSYQANALVRF
jgi:hypothetical protein